MCYNLLMFFENAHCLVTDTGTALPDDAARAAYLALLEKAKLEFGLKMPAYALLPGRALLYFVTPGADLRAVMRTLSPAAGGKYKLLQPEKYSAHLARYIHLEPVKEGLAARPEDYKWSSAAQYLGGAGPADAALVLGLFGADAAQARAKYSEFMAEPVPGKFWRPFDKNRDAVLGDREFTAAHSPHQKPGAF